MMTSHKITHPSWIEIDLQQFKKNIGIIRNKIGNRLFCLPIKANAYGHGLCPIGKAAEEAGVDYLAVAHLKEGIELRKANIGIPILVMGAIHEDQIEELLRYNLEISISSLYKAALVAEGCQRLGQKCAVHLEVDTGMQRTGVRPTTSLQLMTFLLERRCFEIKGVYSHLARNDAFALEQIETFRALLQTPPFAGHRFIAHLASTGGVCFYPSSYFDMVRPALMAFGYLPKAAFLPGIAPCFSLKTKISYFKVVEEGEGISYDHSYITSKRTRIVTLPIGYGDGYRRCLSNRAEVLIRGKRFPIVGSICMDSCMVDIGADEAFVGEEVVLIGKQGDEAITVEEIAALCDTIPYEILCSFNGRLSRHYF
ncbi:MAG: alanine racemase [Verrucomicrobia bacterium]|nr:alanine racemase [Verrucomicrobiota bacterium]